MRKIKEMERARIFRNRERKINLISRFNFVSELFCIEEIRAWILQILHVEEWNIFLKAMKIIRTIKNDVQMDRNTKIK